MHIKQRPNDVAHLRKAVTGKDRVHVGVPAGSTLTTNQANLLVNITDTEAGQLWAALEAGWFVPQMLEAMEKFKWMEDTTLRFVDLNTTDPKLPGLVVMFGDGTGSVDGVVGYSFHGKTGEDASAAFRAWLNDTDNTAHVVPYPGVHEV